MSLDLENDESWLLLLKNNSHVEVEKILENASSSEIQRLLNGQFKSDADLGNCDEMAATYPWNIAAIHGATDTLRVMQRLVVISNIYSTIYSQPINSNIYSTIYNKPINSRRGALVYCPF